MSIYRNSHFIATRLFDKLVFPKLFERCLSKYQFIFQLITGLFLEEATPPGGGGIAFTKGEKGGKTVSVLGKTSSEGTAAFVKGYNLS